MAAKRGPKKRDNEARDRLVHAVVHWLMKDECLPQKLIAQPGLYAESNPALAALREPIGYSAADWIGSERWNAAYASIDWVSVDMPIAAGRPITLKTSHLTPPAIAQMGGATGIARMLLQRYVPAEWVDRPSTIIPGEGSIKEPLRFTVTRIWGLFEQYRQTEPLSSLALAAGFPDMPINLSAQTIGKIFKQRQVLAKFD